MICRDVDSFCTVIMVVHDCSVCLIVALRRSSGFLDQNTRIYKDWGSRKKEKLLFLPGLVLLF